jgi:predicted ribosome quality control (RQC) complex YloA/Tae2 family protein
VFPDALQRSESKGGSCDTTSTQANNVSVQALVHAFEHKSRIDRRRIKVEQETVEQAQHFEMEQAQMEAQIQKLEKNIKDQENEIAKLLAAEEQAFVTNRLYQVMTRSLLGSYR